MSADVLGEMASKQQRLLDKLLTNEDLCAVVMGLLGRLIYLAEVDFKKPVMGIEIDQLVVSGREFKSRVHFHDLAVARPAMWLPKQDFREYVALKAGRMAQALDDNPNLGSFFQRLVEAIAQYSDHSGIPFAQLSFSKHIITRDHVVILEVAGRLVGV